MLSFLSCFHPSSVFAVAVVGVYVNREGQRSRKQELLWHSAPTSFGMNIEKSEPLGGMLVTERIRPTPTLGPIGWG
jgi:hypothetical protein